jgi:hypothetical protein
MLVVLLDYFNWLPRAIMVLLDYFNWFSYDFSEKCAAGYGYQLKREQCEICPAGQYNDAGSGSNSNYCKFCPDGLTTTRTGQSQCVPSMWKIVWYLLYPYTAETIFYKP